MLRVSALTGRYLVPASANYCASFWDAGGTSTILLGWWAGNHHPQDVRLPVSPRRKFASERIAAHNLATLSHYYEAESVEGRQGSKETFWRFDRSRFARLHYCSAATLQGRARRRISFSRHNSIPERWW